MSDSQEDLKMVKPRGLSGNVAIAVFVIAFFCVVFAFFSASWIVSDSRITGAKFDRLGLWTHCFRSLPDPNDEYIRRFFAGCRWIFDPFTKGYDQIRGYLVPGFLVVTEFFYTLTFIGTIFGAVLILLFFLFFTPEHKRFVELTLIIGATLVGAGVSAALAVIVFALFGNRDNWMPGHANNFFGWSFGVAIGSIFALLISGGLFLVETNVQEKKRRQMKESQARFEMEQETKA
ncbi:hypothetical protein WDU94_002365 [Cyamophila willieti]